MPTPHAGFANYFRLARHFAARELRERFLGSVSGGAWALLQPVAQLLVLLFVFGTILKVRLPGADAASFMPFLVCGLWPWIAFSEGTVRGMNAITERAALISKVALPRSALVLAPVLASFALHGVGFIAVLAVTKAMGHPIDPAGIAVAIPLWIALAAFAFGLALALATINVFLRDAGQVVPQLFMLWFYLTPIFYPITLIPERIRDIAYWNPLTVYVQGFRAAWLDGVAPAAGAYAIAFVASGLVVLVGFAMFRRASRHFEDFL